MTPRTLTLALIASAGLNLFLIGGIGGVALISHGQERPFAAPERMRAPMWRAGDGLPDASRQAWRRALREKALDAAPTVREARSLRRTAWESLLKPGFDKEKARADLARSRELDSQGRATVENAILDFAAGLPVEERQTLLEGFRKVAPGRAGLTRQDRGNDRQ